MSLFYSLLLADGQRRNWTSGAPGVLLNQEVQDKRSVKVMACWEKTRSLKGAIVFQKERHRENKSKHEDDAEPGETPSNRIRDPEGIM